MKAESLAEQIDKLVREHLEQVQTEAAGAVQRAFAARTTTKAPKPRPTKRAPSKRRDPKEVAELAERLHARIVAEPGESMAVHSRKLGASVRELHRPMTLLRRAGRLRTTGVRNDTRYYPTPDARVSRGQAADRAGAGTPARSDRTQRVM